MGSPQTKSFCCITDVTLGVRLIAFIGIAVSVLLITVLLNDKLVEDYDISRTTALAFGLDWRHIHPHADTSHKADPEGKMITILMLVYSAVFFVMNITLMYASVTYDQRFAVPWLLCELLGCVSKIGALIFHTVVELDNLSNVFIIGSVIYVVVVMWCWIIVFNAQFVWAHKRSKVSLLSKKNVDGEENIRLECSGESLESVAVGAYVPNYAFATI